MKFKPEVSLVDLSWQMHLNKHAFDSLSANVNGKVRPTGHVFGTIRNIVRLAQMSGAVYLCVDSPSLKRLERMPEYKGTREHSGYNIYNDLILIIAALTVVPNVYYVKSDGLESDDLIASFLLKNQTAGVSLAVYAIDNDILQTPSNYTMFSGFEKNDFKVIDRIEYIKKKYDLDLDYLPVWQKVLKGDPSDNIPNIAPRIDRDLLKKVILDNKDHNDVEIFKKYLKEQTNLYRKWPDLDSLIERNHFVVNPMYVETKTLKLKKLDNREYVCSSLESMQMGSILKALGL